MKTLQTNNIRLATVRSFVQNILIVNIPSYLVRDLITSWLFLPCLFTKLKIVVLWQKYILSLFPAFFNHSTFALQTLLSVMHVRAYVCTLWYSNNHNAYRLFNFPFRIIFSHISTYEPSSTCYSNTLSQCL